MKKIFTIAFLLLNTVIFAQPKIEWTLSIGTDDYEAAQSIKQTIDGGYIVAGSTGLAPHTNYLIAKVSKSGSIEWQKSFGGTADEVCYAIQQTADGGYIAAGSGSSPDGDVSGTNGQYDFWIVKLTASGNITWKKSLGGTNQDEAYSIAQTSDGGYIVAGYTRSNDGDVSGNHGGADYWVVKLSSTGTMEWQRSLGGSDFDYAQSVKQTADGGYIVAGLSRSNDGDISANKGGSDYWIAKLASDGTLQWQKSIGGTYDDDAYSVLQASDGNYIVAGTSVISSLVAKDHRWDYKIVKLSASGDMIWQKNFGGTGDDAAASIQETSGGGYIIAGSTLSSDGDVIGAHSTNPDAWIIQLSSSGDILWQRCLGGSNNDIAPAAQQTADGGYIVAGTSNSTDGDVVINHGASDMWIVKLGVPSAISTINESKSTTIVPNPTTGDLFIKSAKKVSVHVYNMVGLLVTTAGNTDHISIANLPVGMYIVKLYDEQGALLKQEKVVKQ